MTEQYAETASCDPLEFYKQKAYIMHPTHVIPVPNAWYRNWYLTVTIYAGGSGDSIEYQSVEFRLGMFARERRCGGLGEL